ncbi:MAG: Crp/Fnr family transcriptional regulator [Azoarcus sp.]|nr:Crp/Fnr family transcriptional regulator [Azoarcus sp.]
MPTFPPDTLDALLGPALKARVAELELHRGQLLFLQDQVPRRMYFILEGEVVLERCDERGAPVVLQRVGKGLVAEASLQAERYHCDARVSVAGRALWLPRTLLHEALCADAAFALRWISMLGTEVRRLRSRCERLSLNGVAARLLHLIETEGSGGVLPLPSGLKSLATELAVTHEALYRTVARLERDGALRRNAGCILLRQAAPL